MLATRNRQVADDHFIKTATCGNLWKLTEQPAPPFRGSSGGPIKAVLKALNCPAVTIVLYNGVHVIRREIYGKSTVYRGTATRRAKHRWHKHYIVYG